MATCSCILAWRIPMDRGAWQATVHRIEKSWTWLKWLSTYTYLVSSANSFISSLPIWIRFQFLFLIWVLWLGLPVLGKIEMVTVDILVLVPNFRGNTSSFYLLSIILALGLSKATFIMLSYVPSISCDFLSFLPLICCITLISVGIEPSLYPWINVTWSWCMILLYIV